MSDAVPFRFPRIIAWEVTRRCPLKCKHCRANAANADFAGELTTAEVLKVLDSLANTKPMIIWTGGEPMLRDDILELVTHATKLGLRSVMAPCGMLVTPERLQALQQAGVMACSFSLDGATAQAHDAFRGVTGAYEHVTAAMRTARTIGMPFQVNTTVSKLNLGSLDAIYDKAVELGASKLDLFFLVSVGRGKSLAPLALDEDETHRVLDWAFAKALQPNALPIKETCCPTAPAYWQSVGSPGAPHLRPCGCLGGRGFAFLSHTGNLQTCGFIETPCGNVRDYDYSFPDLIAAAHNPLGSASNCRCITI